MPPLLRLPLALAAACAAIWCLPSSPALAEGEVQTHCVVQQPRKKRDRRKLRKLLKHHPQCADPLAVGFMSSRMSFRLPLEWRFDQPPPGALLYVVSLDASGQDTQSQTVELRIERTDDGGVEARSPLPEPLRLSGDAPGNYGPRWSYDGQHLAWQQIGDEPKLLLYDVARQSRREVNLGVTVDDDQALRGQELQIAHYEWDPVSPTVYVKLKHEAGIRSIDARAPTPFAMKSGALPKASDFAISPDRRFLAYRPAGSATGLIVRDLLSRYERKICDEGYYCRDLRWDRSGRRLAFWRSAKGGDQRFWVLAVELPSTPDGQLRSAVVSSGEVSGDSRRNGGSVRSGLAAAWSPDGRSLAWFEGGSIQVAPVAQLWSGRPPKTRRFEVDANADKSDMSWIDARHLLFVQKAGSDFPIALLDTRSGEARSMNARYELHYDLSLSPDGRRLAFSAFDRQQTIMLSELPEPFPPEAQARSKKLPSAELWVDGRTAALNWKGRSKLELRDGVVLTMQAKPDKRRRKAKVTIRLKAPK